MALWLRLLAVLAAWATLVAGEKTYKGYQVLRITPHGASEQNAKHLLRILAESEVCPSYLRSALLVSTISILCYLILF